MKRILSVLFFCIFTIALSACNADDTSSQVSADELNGKYWALLESDNKGDDIAFNSGYEFKDDGKFIYYYLPHISDQPKVYFGSYELDGIELKFHFTEGLDYIDFKAGNDEPQQITIDATVVCNIKIENDILTIKVTTSSSNVWTPEGNYVAVKSLGIDDDGKIFYEKQNLT